MAIKFGRPLERSRFAPAPAEIRTEQLDLPLRLRRNRRSEWSRRMVRENVLTADDLIWPLFIVDGTNIRTPVESMPDVERLSVDQAVRAAERAAKLAIPCVALFPYTDPDKRDDAGSEALNPDNLVCRAIRAIKKEVPEIGVLCDVALDPYTSHGHDGLLRDGVILNDETVAVLVRQALVEAEADVWRELEVHPMRDLAAQEALVALECLHYRLLVTAAERHHVDGGELEVGAHAHLGHRDEVALDDRIMHVTARQDVGDRVTDDLAGAQRALGRARSGVAMMVACHKNLPCKRGMQAARRRLSANQSQFQWFRVVLAPA